MYLQGIGNLQKLGQTEPEPSKEDLYRSAYFPEQVKESGVEFQSYGEEVAAISPKKFPWLLVLAGAAGLYLIFRRRSSPRFGRR